MKITKRKNKFYNTNRFGQPEIRVYHKKAAGNIKIILSELAIAVLTSFTMVSQLL